ncbi:MAG: 3-phosphoserine/phosphohydroxythreonine transaminase [Oscillospiraceae bacterium]
MARVYNFSAGPSVMPEEVLRRAANEMLEYGVSGQSVMEMSHRSPVYEEIINGCEQLLHQILNIPNNYKVLFLQGGASLQFAMIPLNLMSENKKVDAINTGLWSKKAIAEIKKLGTANVVASSDDKTFTYIPKVTKDDFSADADYVHVCFNNTIYGTKFPYIPDTNGKPLVADMSSCILSEPIDVSKFGIIFAGAQKNMGPAGLTVVIIREDLVGKADENLPTMLNFETHVKNSSMFNTPPTYAIYVCKLVLEWIKNTIGGLDKMKEINEKKAKMIYDFLDNSKLFSATVFGEDRSIMNIPFVTGDSEKDADFIKKATAAGFINLKGHRSVGGMRASIYNAMPVEGVEKLVDFMREYEKNND